MGKGTIIDLLEQVKKAYNDTEAFQQITEIKVAKIGELMQEQQGNNDPVKVKQLKKEIKQIEKEYKKAKKKL